MESLNLAHHWSSCWWGSQSPISSSTDWGLRTMSQWKTWLIAGTQPRWLVNKDQESLDLRPITMASQPPVLALRQWNCSRSWGQLKRWFRHTHRCWQLRDQDLPDRFPWVKSCVNVPNLRRNLQPNGAFQNHNTETRGAMLSCVASTSFVAKGRLASFIPSTSSVPFRKKGRGLSRPARRSQWMAGRKKKRRKNGQHQPLGVNWNDCTWYSETPCWCAWLPFPSFLNSTWRRKTLTLSMIGSMDLSWGAVGLPLRSRRCSWQSVMHGERFMSWCMVACISKKLLTRSKTTACSGWEKSMKESSPRGPKVNQRKARTRRAHGGTPSANLNGEKKGKGPGDKGGKGKGKGKSKPSDWPSNWAFKNPKGVPFCRDYFIKKNCQGQCGRSHNCPVVNSEGWVCNAGPKEHKPENCPHKAWKEGTAADGAVEHPGSPEGGNITQGDSGAGGTWSAPTTVGGGDPLETGGAPDLSGTLSPAAPNLALGTAADGAVAPRRNGVHPSETGGSSPDIPRTGGPNDSNLALGTAANGAVTPRKTGVHSKRVRPAEPAASQSGKSAKHSNLTGRCPGQGLSIQNRMSSGSELSEAYSWLRYVPNRLRQRVLPTVAQGAFNPGPILVLLYAGKDDPLSLDSCLHAHYPRLSPYVVAFDTRRSPQPLGHDSLEDQPYGKLCQAAIEGRVRLVCGGPNCRTWSILRWFPKPNAPAPVRGRSEDLVWGLPTLTALEQEEVDGESLLILRQMFLTTLMKQNCSLPVASFLEHPRDPVECSSSPSASRCSSLWATKMFKAWYPTRWVIP